MLEQQEAIAEVLRNLQFEVLDCPNSGSEKTVSVTMDTLRYLIEPGTFILRADGTVEPV